MSISKSEEEKKVDKAAKRRRQKESKRTLAKVDEASTEPCTMASEAANGGTGNHLVCDRGNWICEGDP